jgi:hypothetical protein
MALGGLRTSSFDVMLQLIAIVDTGLSRVVQFSHFFVKEYLTSARLATSNQDFSRFHIVLEPAHTIMAQAWVSVLLQLDDRNVQNDVGENTPLARYAAEYWVNHTQFEDVASRIKGIEYRFDLDKPYFAAWRELYDIDTDPLGATVFFEFTPISKSDATLLYYAALCGFPKFVEQLIVKYPQHVDNLGGYYVTPAVAALAGRYFQLAQLLHMHGSSVDPRGVSGKTPLHSAAFYGDLEMVQILLDYGVDVNAQTGSDSTPLSLAIIGRLNDPRVVRSLLDHGADPNIPAQGGSTPLHQASGEGMVKVIRPLIEYGVSVEVQDNIGRTPLDVTSEEQREEIINLLLLVEHLAK